MLPIIFLLAILLYTHTPLSGNNALTPTVSPPPTIIVEESSMNAQEVIHIAQNNYDLSVIPDKYNTGPLNTNLKKATFGICNGITLSESSVATDIVLSLMHNQTLTGSVEINSMDFSDYRFRVYHESLQQTPLTIVFNNCKFGGFKGFETGNAKVYFEFNNCSFTSCSISNATFNRCYFGKGIVDGLNPFNNVFVNDCYFSDKSEQGYVDTTGVHTDGTQIYGSKTEGCSNIHFENCRFELPYLHNAANRVNACIMLQIENSDATDITFNNCYANGGGYTIYAYAKAGSISDSSLTNITVGCCHKWGDDNTFIYPTIDPNIKLTDILPADHLYVSSVWQSDNNVHFSVTNDTNISRTLLLVTNRRNYLYSIPPCYKYSQLTDDITFSDFPFDLLYSIEAGVDWMVFFDITDPSTPKQIRSVNYSDYPIVIPKITVYGQ